MKRIRDYSLALRITIGAVVVALGITLVITTGDTAEPETLSRAASEPAPVCFGKPATHVFVPFGDTRDFEGAVEVTLEFEGASQYFRAGGDTRDVLFGIEPTDSGGAIGAPYGAQDLRNLPGDDYCLSDGKDTVYASSNVNQLDRIDTGDSGPGSLNGFIGDFVYNHGGSLVVKLGASAVAPQGNKVWVGRVPRGGTVRIIGGPDTDHVFMGRIGAGVAYFYNGKGGFDHIHPCIGGETYTGPSMTPEEFEALTGIVTRNVEYIGSEAELGNPSPDDACSGSV